MDEEDEAPLDESRLGDLAYVIANRAKVERVVRSIRNNWKDKLYLIQIAVELEHMLHKIDGFAAIGDRTGLGGEQMH